MAALVIVGAQWGDEGKGKVVDLLAANVGAVVRFQGGPNAGHTLVVEGEKVVLHHIPSGVLQRDTINVIGPGVLVDPITCLEEIRALEERGILEAGRQLTIDLSCHLILPIHRILDRAREAAAAAGKIGTTGRGIGPCAEDAVGRRGVRIMDILDLESMGDRLVRNLREKSAILEDLGVAPPSLDEVLDPVKEAVEGLRPYLGDGRSMVHDALVGPDRVLFEGAQGTFLDPLHGTYPFVTSTPCVAPAAPVGAGAGCTGGLGVLGITKAYTTRVGSGPFPTELLGPMGERLRVAGAEFGATTGRPRRCGWLDLPMLKYAARVNGITALAVTKIDVLSGLEDLQVCVAYRHRDAVHEIWPAHLPSAELEPVLIPIPGWTEPLGDARSVSDLPVGAQAYLAFIEESIDVPIALVSVGPDREETLTLFDPFGTSE